MMPIRAAASLAAILVTTGCGFRRAASASPSYPAPTYVSALAAAPAARPATEVYATSGSAESAPTARAQAMTIDADEEIGGSAAPVPQAAQAAPVPAPGAVAVVRAPEKLVVEGWLQVETDDVVAV